MAAYSNLLLTPEMQLALNRKLLSRFRAKIVFNKFGDQSGISTPGGVAENWRRMEVIRPVSVASQVGTTTWPPDATYTNAAAALLTEGTFFVPSVAASWASITATVQQFGQAAYISEWAEKLSVDPQVPEYVKNFSEAMPELLDLVTRDILLAATNIQYANGRASQSAVVSGDFFTLVEYRKALRTLKNANAESINGKWPIIVHPNTTYDLQGDSNITNLWTNGGAGNKQGDIFDDTFSDIPFGGRVFESTLAPLVRASGYTDYYNTFVVGKEAYGTTKVNKIPSEVIVHPPGTSGVADPLNQVGTVGWKANFAAVMLNQANLVRIVHQTSSFTGTRAAAPV